MQEKPKFKIEPSKAAVGGILVGLGILLPKFLSYGTSHVGIFIQKAALEGQSSYLLIAALLLVALNSLRSFPIYLGAFLIVKAIRYQNRTWQWVKTLILSAVIIFGVYFALEKIYDIRYNYMVPAILMLSVILAVDRLDFSMVNIVKELLLLAMLLLAVQFLDMIPSLPRDLFGRGEISSYIKNLAVIMDAGSLLGGTCLLFLFIFAFNAGILWMQISLENQLRKTKKEAEDEREQLIETRLRLLDARMNKEKQFLVHDLKAPLTSIQIWVDLIRMKVSEGAAKAKDADTELFDDCGGYVDRIDGSIAHMNMLISELMNSKAKNVFAVRDVLKLFSSQTSPAYYNEILHQQCDCEDAKVEVNRTNFVRALINLTENAGHSIHHDHGDISLTVTADKEHILFTVRDNGEGIAADMLDKIWEEGVSGKNSTGMGLCFVREVVRDAGGEADIVSQVGKGTAVTLRIPRYIE